MTNLILFEFGHPIHAFDLDHVAGGSIAVRVARARARSWSPSTVSRATSTPDDLVIADAEGPVALAGVMGGRGSEISGTTKRVLIECAISRRAVFVVPPAATGCTPSRAIGSSGESTRVCPRCARARGVNRVELAHGSAVPGSIHKFDRLRRCGARPCAHRAWTPCWAPPYRSRRRRRS